MSTLVEFEIVASVDASPADVFDRLADLASYDRWLPGSAVYGGLQDLSDSPVREGTTYRDCGQPLSWQGRVTRAEPGRRLTFVQATTAKLGPLRPSLEIEIDYRLDDADGRTKLRRGYVMRGPRYLRPARRRLREQTQPENQRVVDQLVDSFVRE